MDIRDFLLDYVYARDLKDFADDVLGLKKAGNKEDVVDRILASERFHPDMLRDWFLREDLRDICEDLRIQKSGNKQIL